MSVPSDRLFIGKNDKLSADEYVQEFFDNRNAQVEFNASVLAYVVLFL